MGSFKKGSLIVIFIFSVIYGAEKISSGQILYLAQSGQIEEALDTYQEKVLADGHDYTILQHLGYILLAKGIENPNPEIQKLSMIGAGMASSSRCLDLLEKGVNSIDLQTQMLAIQFLSRINDDRIDPILIKAMSSYYLPIRFEAAYLLAERNHNAATGQIEALMHRLPPMFKPFFPPLFAMIPTYQAKAVFYDLLFDRHLDVRLEAIHSVGNFSRDDLLPLIRKKLTSSSLAEKEAALFTIGKLHDYDCIDLIQKYCTTETENIQLMASATLALLGQGKTLETIKQYAKNKNLFAITLLGDFSGAEDLLYSLSFDPDTFVRLNATISLLKRKDPRSVSHLKKILLWNPEDLAIIPKYSPGRSLQAWALIFSPQQQKNPIDPTLTIKIQEHLLQMAADLPENNFIDIAQTLMSAKQNSLIPRLIALLENLRTEQSIALLKKGTNMLGAPLIRNYCNVALFRLGENDDAKTQMLQWIQRTGKNHIIHFSPMINRKNPIQTSPYDLSSDETTRLLIDTFAALTDEGEDINSFLRAFRQIHPDNRYVFAGYLMKRAE